MVNVSEVQDALFASWSLESSTLWTLENPARGQCGVSALVVQDILGGEILKTRFHEAWHFYNRIGGVAHDFTASQFQHPIVYQDILVTRQAAFLDANESQYSYLLAKVRRVLCSSTKEKGDSWIR